MPKSGDRVKKLCFCRSIRPCLLICRAYGCLPIESYHNEGECMFRTSKIWLAYSIAVITALFAHLCFDSDLLRLFHVDENRPIHAILESVTNVIYSIYVTLLCIMNVFNAGKFANTMNQTGSAIHEGLLCQSALHVIKNLQWGFLALTVSVIAMQFSAIIWLQHSESYETHFDYKIYTHQISQNVTFIFYMIFTCSCSIFKGLLACFEKLTVDALQCRPLHPMKGIDVKNNRGTFLGIIDYALCKENHRCGVGLRGLRSHELVEYLRCLHEELCVTMRMINSSLNPQMLLHMMFELTVLIVKCYAVVIYFAYEFGTATSRTINFLNCVFVLLHTLGLFVFLKNAQNLQNMVKGIISFLMEYSTRISTPEEHLQVRLFLNKLKWRRPLNASGVVDIDLSVAGPVCANILTYVLVALQFDVPKP